MADGGSQLAASSVNCKNPIRIRAKLQSSLGQINARSRRAFGSGCSEEQDCGDPLRG
jgi:hypothetical protein